MLLLLAAGVYVHVGKGNNVLHWHRHCLLLVSAFVGKGDHVFYCYHYLLLLSTFVVLSVWHCVGVGNNNVIEN